MRGGVPFFTKEFDAGRFKAVPGMMVPTKYRNATSLKFFRGKYGDDCVKIVDERDAEGIAAMLGSNSSSEAIQALQKTNADQAKTIRDLEAKVATLEQRLRSKSSQ